MSRGLTTLLLIAALSAAGGAARPANAQDQQQNLRAGELPAKQLLVLMDKDKNGKVSREEFMDFMAAEFDRLDINKDGELDVKELTELHLRPGHGFGK
jgi:hypothetical protein